MTSCWHGVGCSGTGPNCGRLDEWDDNDGPLSLSECNRCHEWKLCMMNVDPFLAEIEPGMENPPAMWCWPCYEERADQV